MHVFGAQSPFTTPPRPNPGSEKKFFKAERCLSFGSPLNVDQKSRGDVKGGERADAGQATQAGVVAGAGEAEGDQVRLGTPLPSVSEKAWEALGSPHPVIDSHL